MNVNRVIKRLRQTNSLTLDELAKKSNLTKGYLSKVENAKRSPPVSTLQSLAVALGVDISEFFKAGSPHNYLSDSLDIARNRDRNDEESKEVSTESGYAYKPLVENLKNKYMSPFLMTIEKGKTGVFSHDSEEFGYVIEGEIQLEYEGQSYVLKQGESFYFDSRKPHQIINKNKETAVILSVNYNYRRF
jgi:transcriptional regulator with XRE-family HTH domain